MAFSSAGKTARPQDHPASLIIPHADDLVPIVLHPIGPDGWYDSAADSLTIETYIAESGWNYSRGRFKSRATYAY
jgi:hypothetical protein